MLKWAWVVICVCVVYGANPDVRNCTEFWFDQNIDHFNWATPPLGATTFKQRYYVYDKVYQAGGPIFFYAGNEGDVTLYANATGLMWENAAKFGALLLFAEHRYYGLSQPFGDNSSDHMHWLTHEQALADYAHLLYTFKQTRMQGKLTPTIVFGGSYGGMLSAWMRIKYPNIVDGAIAASAPILAFDGQNYDSRTYWQVVTRDATPAAGAPTGCDSLVRKAFSDLFALGQTASGRAQLTSTFKMCKSIGEDDVLDLARFQQVAWDTLAMGNYPYPFNYLTGGGPLLPAWPVRAACAQTIATFVATNDTLQALNQGSGLYNNATQDVKCYDLPDDDEYDGIWDYQWCTETLPQETYFATDGVQDMFWNAPVNKTFVQERCQKLWGVQPRPEWIVESYGVQSQLRYASNIVFSNGLYDPWSSAGVLKNISDSVVAILIPEGGHHLDLFFSNSEDPESVRFARAFELAQISKWISAARAHF